MNRLINAFHTALAAEGMNLRDWTDQAEIPYSTVHTFTRGRPPNNELIRALTGNWKDPETGLGLLVAYLQDEIERAGRNQGEIEIRIPTMAHKLVDDLDIINRHLQQEPDLTKLFRSLADTLRTEDQRRQPKSDNPKPPRKEK